jgi:hypothetical protein
LLVALFSLAMIGGTACGDPVRVPGYEGAPIFQLRAKVPADLAQSPVFLSLQLENGDQRLWRRSEQPLTPDALGQVELPIRGAPTTGDTPVARSRGTGQSVRVAVMRISTGPTAGRPASTLHDFLVHAEAAAPDLALLEPGGPTLSVEAGYQLVRRRCLPDGTVSLDHLPLTTAVQLELDPPAGMQGYDLEVVALARCGITPGPDDRGRAVRVDYAPFEIKALAWSPGPDRRLFLMTGPAQEHIGTEILVLDAAAATGARPTSVARGRFAPWLAVRGNGTFLFTRVYGAANLLLRYQLAPLTPGAEPLPTMHPETGPSVISPDGRRIAMASGYAWAATTGVIRSLDTGEERPLPHLPVAWSPDSSSVLVTTTAAGLDGALAIVGPDGTTRPLAAAPFGHVTLAFWNDRGPHLVSVSADKGVHIVGLESREQATIVSPQDGWAEKVEVASDAGRVFVWSRRCAGFGQRVCSSRLIRFSVADRTSDTAATAGTASVYAVTGDGGRVAIAAGGEVFLKDM